MKRPTYLHFLYFIAFVDNKNWTNWPRLMSRILRFIWRHRARLFRSTEKGGLMAKKRRSIGRPPKREEYDFECDCGRQYIITTAKGEIEEISEVTNEEEERAGEGDEETPKGEPAEDKGGQGGKVEEKGGGGQGGLGG